MLTRMGMRSRSSDTAAGLEIGVLATVAALIAVAVALPASALVLRLLDPAPGLRPDVLFRVPWSSIAFVLAGVVLAAIGSALLVGRSARRTDGAQVMRDAT
jgi:putative ABC transport system permease protein